MILNFINNQGNPKISKFIEEFASFLTEIGSVLILSDHAQELNTKTIDLVLKLKKPKIFKKNEYFLNNLEIIEEITKDQEVSKTEIIEKLHKTFSFIIFETDIKNFSRICKINLDHIFLFINVEEYKHDEVYELLQKLLINFNDCDQKVNITLFAYGFEKTNINKLNFLGFQNIYKTKIFEDVLYLKDKNYEKSKKIFKDLLAKIKA